MQNCNYITHATCMFYALYQLVCTYDPNCPDPVLCVVCTYHPKCPDPECHPRPLQGIDYDSGHAMKAKLLQFAVIMHRVWRWIENPHQRILIICINYLNYTNYIFDKKKLLYVYFFYQVTFYRRAWYAKQGPVLLEPQQQSTRALAC